MKPYYDDGTVTIYHGDSRYVHDWLAADLLLTDPPYGIAWRQGALKRSKSDGHPGTEGDDDTGARDHILRLWVNARRPRPAIMFGSLMLSPPLGTKQVLVYRKPSNAGTRGAMGGFRRDAEAVYLIGPWPTALGGRSSVVATLSPTQGNPSSPQGRFNHPHAKPLDVLCQLLDAWPMGVVADPFLGSGSTLVAAKQLGRKAIGVEIDERHCEMAARRCAQEVMAL